MKKPQPIDLVSMMPRIDELLISLLEGLSIIDWEKETIVPGWRIKDIAAHLLDGNLRTLSMLRDEYYGEKAENLDSYEAVVAYLNDLNADWVRATKRLSPKVIIDLLQSTGKEYCDYLKTLGLENKAGFSVGWAGEMKSKNWFHIAREYTEKWHHQQQIRLALGLDNELLKEEWYYPYLDTSVRGLPHHYRDVVGQKGDLIKITFRGKMSKHWFLRYTDKWELYTSIDELPNCEVIINDEIAWRIFTKGIVKEAAIQKSEIHGKQELGIKIFDMLAVMA